MASLAAGLPGDRRGWRMTKFSSDGELDQDGDTAEMTRAIAWFRRNRISISRPAKIQLKIGPLNYYATSGTIYFDGGGKPEVERGLAGLKRVLERSLKRTLLPIDGTVVVLAFKPPTRQL